MLVRSNDKFIAAAEEDEIGWDDDSDEEDEGADATKTDFSKKPASVRSSSTIQPPAQSSLKPADARTSDDKSQADSEASYDVVGAASGKTTQAPNSPKESRKEAEDSDDDWE